MCVTGTMNRIASTNKRLHCNSPTKSVDRFPLRTSLFLGRCLGVAVSCTLAALSPELGWAQSIDRDQSVTTQSVTTRSVIPQSATTQSVITQSATTQWVGVGEIVRGEGQGSQVPLVIQTGNGQIRTVSRSGPQLSAPFNGGSGTFQNDEGRWEVDNRGGRLNVTLYRGSQVIRYQLTPGR